MILYVCVCVNISSMDKQLNVCTTAGTGGSWGVLVLCQCLYVYVVSVYSYLSVYVC